MSYRHYQMSWPNNQGHKDQDYGKCEEDMCLSNAQCGERYGTKGHFVWNCKSNSKKEQGADSGCPWGSEVLMPENSAFWAFV